LFIHLFEDPSPRTKEGFSRAANALRRNERTTAQWVAFEIKSTQIIVVSLATNVSRTDTQKYAVADHCRWKSQEKVGAQGLLDVSI